MTSQWSDNDLVWQLTNDPLTNVVGVSAGLYTTCALQSSGAVSCWGDPKSGVIGDGDYAKSLVDVYATGNGPTVYGPRMNGPPVTPNTFGSLISGQLPT